MTRLARVVAFVNRHLILIGFTISMCALAIAVYSVAHRAHENRQAIVRSCNILSDVIVKSQSGQSASAPLVEGLLETLEENGRGELVKAYRENLKHGTFTIPKPDCERAARDPKYRIR